MLEVNNKDIKTALKMKLFAEIVNSFQQLTIFAKSSIADVVLMSLM